MVKNYYILRGKAVDKGNTQKLYENAITKSSEEHDDTVAPLQSGLSESKAPPQPNKGKHKSTLSEPPTLMTALSNTNGRRSSQPDINNLNVPYLPLSGALLSPRSPTHSRAPSWRAAFAATSPRGGMSARGRRSARGNLQDMIKSVAEYRQIVSRTSSPRDDAKGINEPQVNGMTVSSKGQEQLPMNLQSPKTAEITLDLTNTNGTVNEGKPVAPINGLSIEITDSLKEGKTLASPHNTSQQEAEDDSLEQEVQEMLEIEDAAEIVVRLGEEFFGNKLNHSNMGPLVEQLNQCKSAKFHLDPDPQIRPQKLFRSCNLFMEWVQEHKKDPNLQHAKNIFKLKEAAKVVTSCNPLTFVKRTLNDEDVNQLTECFTECKIHKYHLEVKQLESLRSPKVGKQMGEDPLSTICIEFVTWVKNEKQKYQGAYLEAVKTVEAEDIADIISDPEIQRTMNHYSMVTTPGYPMNGKSLPEIIDFKPLARKLSRILERAFRTSTTEDAKQVNDSDLMKCYDFMIKVQKRIDNDDPHLTRAMANLSCQIEQEENQEEKDQIAAATIAAWIGLEAFISSRNITAEQIDQLEKLLVTCHVRKFYLDHKMDPQQKKDRCNFFIECVRNYSKGNSTFNETLYELEINEIKSIMDDVETKQLANPTADPKSTLAARLARSTLHKFRVSTPEDFLANKKVMGFVATIMKADEASEMVLLMKDLGTGQKDATSIIAGRLIKSNVNKFRLYDPQGFCDLVDYLVASSNRLLDEAAKKEYRAPGKNRNQEANGGLTTAAKSEVKAQQQPAATQVNGQTDTTDGLPSQNSSDSGSSSGLPINHGFQTPSNGAVIKDLGKKGTTTVQSPAHQLGSLNKGTGDYSDPDDDSVEGLEAQLKAKHEEKQRILEEKQRIAASQQGNGNSDAHANGVVQSNGVPQDYVQPSMNGNNAAPIGGVKITPSPVSLFNASNHSSPGTGPLTQSMTASNTGNGNAGAHQPGQPQQGTGNNASGGTQQRAGNSNSNNSSSNWCSWLPCCKP